MSEFKARVYLAGPYTQGDTVRNVSRAISKANHLVESGYAPYVPHLTLLWDLHTHYSYDQWLSLCREWLQACDAVFRMPGYSPGAEEEEKLALRLGIPVVYSVQQLDRIYGEGR